MIEYYGARWKIEAGFKEIKQEIGSARSQTRDAQAVLNHLNFCMMGATLTWIYADRLQNTPDRRFKIRAHQLAIYPRRLDLIQNWEEENEIEDDGIF